jgi:Fe-S-cluster-containing hydrogenase component 2
MVLNHHLFKLSSIEYLGVILSQLWIFRDFDKCSGCRLCEIACSLRHEGVVWPEASRITVLEFAPGIAIPHTCVQCYDYPCVKACPTNALYVDGKTGAVLVDTGRCTLCGACVKVCPARVPKVVKGKNYVLICDLCGGEPECVKACKEAGFNALELVPKPEKAYVDPYITLPEVIASKLSSKVYKGFSKEVLGL